MIALKSPFPNTMKTEVLWVNRSAYAFRVGDKIQYMMSSSEQIIYLVLFDLKIQLFLYILFRWGSKQENVTIY